MNHCLSMENVCNDPIVIGSGLLRIPPLRDARLEGMTERAFSVVAPQLWNSFPREVVLASDVILEGLLPFRMLNGTSECIYVGF